MDIVEQMAADIAMKMNGGEWTDGKWYSQGHHDAWVKAVQPYADEIIKLREDKKLAFQLMDVFVKERNRMKQVLHRIAKMQSAQKIAQDALEGE